ncbi:MAG: hypothetical protein EZS28_021061 [Streblomastix strix]|uniref:Tc1-like transposase DDE domain-containing protein n=1 Tax=Streblomastix strix TaxID=222440 RepID=A0A5J4VLN7_9EUKA|nr:MAG: hypothetical protein EZS28_021061 [Streblomastix strix]
MVVFIDEVLTPLIKDIHEAYPQLDNIFIHLDNATSHNTRATASFLEGQQQGDSFKTAKEAVDAATKILHGISKYMLKSCFQNWCQRA